MELEEPVDTAEKSPTGEPDDGEKSNHEFDVNNSLAFSFRPGRLTSQEILERLFPAQSSSVRELVLHGCSGDVVKAIEQFLSMEEQNQKTSKNETTVSFRHVDEAAGAPKTTVNESVKDLEMFDNNQCSPNRKSENNNQTSKAIRKAALNLTAKAPSTFDRSKTFNLKKTLCTNLLHQEQFRLKTALIGRKSKNLGFTAPRTSCYYSSFSPMLHSTFIFPRKAPRPRFETSAFRVKYPAKLPLRDSFFNFPVSTVQAQRNNAKPKCTVTSVLFQSQSSRP